MQITMAYSNEISLALPPLMKGPVGGAPRIDMAKPQFRKPQRFHPKSQPFDPEDLRRRLYVVIAEREAQSEKRQRQRVDSLPAKWAQVERERDTQQLYIERLAATNTATWMPDITAPARRSVGGGGGGGAVPKARQQPSLQDKLRNRHSLVAPSELSDAAANTDECPKYRHVPEQAAAQFSRTTTSGGMQGDKPAVHSLSRAALRLYVEGATSAERSAIDSSITPGKQRKILQRARSQQERQHGRNQFQETRIAGDEAATWRRVNKGGPAGERGAEDHDGSGGGGVSALADLHLHAYPSQGQGQGDGDGLRHSSEETLVDTATANEHRVDWTQSDEMLPHERRGAKLLRKTTSILSLKGKLGHLRRNSGGGGGGDNKEGDGENNNSNNRLRIVTIQEDCDEQAEADADDGSTPMSPHSGTSSSRSARLGIWGRLRRN
ncbi:hypothetical protein F5Y12DRAFT_636869 [Xylaria sp. FL1777]|nr:hypothetical protein F5Y12DRAFT_636869 [Xylaria sp. FL1777]